MKYYIQKKTYKMEKGNQIMGTFYWAMQDLSKKGDFFPTAKIIKMCDTQKEAREVIKAAKENDK